MKSKNWGLIFVLAAFLGILVGYVVTLIVRPTLLPAMLRFGSLTQPTTVMFLGVDVSYTKSWGENTADLSTFSGRSDTILVAHLDPIKDAITIISVPRDTAVLIPGHGVQKINAANAYGGPRLARDAVSQFLGIPIDHYVVLNLQGLVKLVDELGGITVDIPKSMHYMDWTAKLKIDLEPGYHTLTGSQAMGFVRFRHDVMGDIGRVQRQEIFLRAVLDRALRPEVWSHIPALIGIAGSHITTDMNEADMLSIASFIRAVPKKNQQLVMLPGTFAADGSGNWIVSQDEAQQFASRVFGAVSTQSSRESLYITVENMSSDLDLSRKLAKYLRAKGYRVVVGADHLSKRKITQIIAQRGNSDDAEEVRADLANCGQVVNASIGDLQSSVTIFAGDDMANMIERLPQ